MESELLEGLLDIDSKFKIQYRRTICAVIIVMFNMTALNTKLLNVVLRRE